MLDLRAGGLDGGIEQLLAILGHLVGARGVVQLLLRGNLLREQVLHTDKVAPGELQIGIGRFNSGLRLGGNRGLQVGGLPIPRGRGFADLGL